MIASRSNPSSPFRRHLRRALQIGALLLVAAWGMGWKCVVDLDRVETVISPGDVPWAPHDTADLCLIRDGDRLLAWIDGNEGPGYAIGMLISTDDGATWTPAPGGPAVGRDLEWERNHVTSPHVVREGDGFTMWYGATADALPAVGYQIGIARSLDGLRWTKGGDPALALASSPGGDDYSVADPCVVPHRGGYRMYYSGARKLGNFPQFRVWMAESEDGENWSGRRAVVKDLPACAAPHALVRRGVTHLWYVAAGSDGSPTFDRLRYRYSRGGEKFGAMPWRRRTLAAKGDLGAIAARDIYSPFADVDESGAGWLYLSVHDADGVWRIVRMPVRLRRSWFGI